MMVESGASVLVETGVARHGLAYSKSDGASTIVFGIYAKTIVEAHPTTRPRVANALAEDTASVVSIDYCIGSCIT